MFNKIYIHFANKITPARARHIINTKKLCHATANKVLMKSGVNISDSAKIIAPFHFGSGNISIGENSYINYDCIFLDNYEIKIGDNVLIGPRTTLCTVTHQTCSTDRLDGENIYSKIIIEDNVFIGAGVIVLPGVTIGKNSTIAANSVVNTDVPANCLYAGTPAKFKKPL